MDWHLNQIIIKYFPFTIEDYKSTELYEKKQEFHKKIEAIIIEYNATKKLQLPIDLNADMQAIIKKMMDDN